MSREQRATGGKDVKGTLLAVRMSTNLMEAIDHQVDTMRAEAPWVTMTRSDAVRWLLGVALEHERARLGLGDRDPAPRAI